MILRNFSEVSIELIARNVNLALTIITNTQSDLSIVHLGVETQSLDLCNTWMFL